MRQGTRACLILCLALLLWAVGHSRSTAAEGFHPEGRDPRRIETDKRALEERKSEEKREDSEAWFKKSVEGKDLTREKKTEFHDADRLLKESINQQARDKQVDHAWKGHSDEFSEIGINDKTKLKQHIDEVRSNYDVRVDLPRGREAFGKMDKGTEGTIVIDNVGDAENGGTAFRHENIIERMHQLKEQK